MSRTNDLGQPIGRDLARWEPPPSLHAHQLTGSHTTLRPLHAGDADAVLAAMQGADPALYTYMSFEPFRSPADVADLIEFMEAQPDWLPYAIEVDGQLRGFAAYLRMNPRDGAVEIGSILYSPRLQQTTAATEALYLMIHHAFDSGYRRVEWKCDALNAPSRSAADRLGFRYEGTFLNATHYKGRNRDTAWFAMTVEEWPELREPLEAWLDPGNFDADGHQLQSLIATRESASP